MFSETILTGRIGRIKKNTLQDNSPVTNLSIAETRVRKGEKTTTWWDVALFGKTCEIADKVDLTEGDIVSVTGQAEARAYEHEGRPRAQLKMIANRFLKIASSANAKDKDQAPAESGSQSQAPEPPAPEDDFGFEGPEGEPAPTGAGDDW